MVAITTLAHSPRAGPPQAPTPAQRGLAAGLEEARLDLPPDFRELLAEFARDAVDVVIVDGVSRQTTTEIVYIAGQ